MRLTRFGKWGVLSLLSAVSLLGATVNSQIADAAETGDKAAVQALLQKGSDVNASQGDGMTALHWAADNGDLQLAELLVRAGANVKVVNRFGVTPLSSAAENGNGPMVELFLKAGADPNTVLAGGETVLMTAARTGDIETVGALLSHGATVNAKEAHSGQTALMWAAAEGNTQAVEALLKAGADFKTRDRYGFSPLLYASREGRIGILPALLKAGEDPSEAIEPLHRQRQHSAFANRIANPSRPGTSALALAVVNGHFELAASLLKAGADPNAARQGWTALHAVTWVRKPGLGDNAPGPQGSGNMTSLELVKALVEHGANVNARMTKIESDSMLTKLNTKGATPFMLAARTADAELMRLLAKLGADPLITNEDNSTPLMVAAGLGTRAPGEDPGTESEVIEAMQVALDLGGDINAVDTKGETVMHGAAYKGMPGAVQFLADKGAKMDVWNRKNKQGWAPLNIAQGYRFDNFIPLPATEAVFRRLMTAAGVSTDIEVKFCDRYAKEACTQ